MGNRIHWFSIWNATQDDGDGINTTLNGLAIQMIDAGCASKEVHHEE